MFNSHRILGTNRGKVAILYARIHAATMLTSVYMILGRLGIGRKVACLSEVPMFPVLFQSFENLRQSNCRKLNARMLDIGYLSVVDHHTTFHRLSVEFR